MAGAMIPCVGGPLDGQERHWFFDEPRGYIRRGRLTWSGSALIWLWAG